MATEMGIINEIGDIGLGFSPITGSDAKVLEASQAKEEAPKTEVVTEENAE
mgnify:CR=1 FL=1